MLRAIAVAAFLLPASLQAGERLESLRLKYDVECERIKAPLIDLGKKFKQRLEVIYEEYTDEGDLSGALAAKSAAEAKGDPSDADIKASPEKVASAQKIYLKARDSREKQARSKLRTLTRAYDTRLRKLKVELTKGRRLDEAAAVDAEIAKVEEKLEGIALRIGAEKGLCEISITSNVKVSIKELRPGAERLSGGYRPKFETVAKEVEGAEFTKVPWGKTSSFEITAQSDGYIYLYYHSGAEIDPKALHEKVENLISGPFIKPGTTDRVVLKRGQKFSFKAGEGGIIAKEIEVKK